MAIPKDPFAEQTSQEAEDQETVEVAGVMSGVSNAVQRQILKGMTKRGTSAVDYTVVPENKKPAPSNEAIVEPELPPGETPSDAQAPVTPTRPDVEPVSEEEAARVMQAREAAEEAPRMVPSPTPAQRAEGLAEGPVNTRFYDEDSLANTIEAVARTTPDADKPKTIQELYEKAQASGVPARLLQQIFEGESMSANVGGSALAEQLAGLQMLHDVSAKRLDELMRLAQANSLDDAGQLELREVMAQHNIIYQKMKGAKTDVARAMNVFKGARDMMSDENAAGLRGALDQMGGDFDLSAFADEYLRHSGTTGARSKQNRLLEKSLIGKTFDAVVYTNQSLLLTNPDTHVYNGVANAVSMIADAPEKALAAGVGTVRKRLAAMLGQDANPDQYYIDDVINSYSGVMNGINDAWVMMGREFSEGTGAKDARINPVSSEYFAGTQIGTFRGKVLQTPELGENIAADAIYKVLDIYGTVLSIPLKGLGVADKGFVGLAQRMQLHEEAGRYGREVYEAALNGGATHEQAVQQAEKAASKFLSERPADIDASVQDFSKRVTLQAEISRDTAMGRFVRGFQSFATKGVSRYALRPLLLFTQSVSNLAIEGSARVPILNFLSPRWKSEYNKGGRHRDLAVGRVAFGGMLMTSAAYAAYNGRMTGPGPVDTEDKRALSARGWQPYALVVGEEEVTGGNVSRLKDMLGEDYVTTGTGEYEGKVYISLKRLEPMTMPILMGVTVGDTLKYQAYDEDERGTAGAYLQTMGDTAMALGSEYTTNMPQMQAISEIMSIANQRQTDGGDRLVGILDAYTRTQGEFYMRGLTPGANLTNSAIAGKLERMISPQASNTFVTNEQNELTEDVLGIKGTAPIVRSFWQAYNKWMSRVPVYSDNVPVRLDAYGNEVGSQAFLPAAPTRMSEGPRDNDGNLIQDEYFQILAMIGHGISEPPRAVKGVTLTAEQQNRFIEIYTTHKMAGMDFKQKTIKGIKEYMDNQQRNNQPAFRGDVQKIYNDVVSEYRDVATQKMFGTIVYDKKFDLYDIKKEEGQDIEEDGASLEMIDKMKRRRLIGR